MSIRLRATQVLSAIALLYSLQLLAEPVESVYISSKTLTYSDPLILDPGGRLQSLTLSANIIPSNSARAFDFIVSVSNDDPQSIHAGPSSASFMLTGDTCSGPLEFALRKIDENYNYSYQTFFEEFSPLAEIDIELTRVGKQNGNIAYSARVNGVEKLLMFEKRIKSVSLSVRGAKMELSKIKLLTGKNK